jgi:S1-C subfamily serine protease
MARLRIALLVLCFALAGSLAQAANTKVGVELQSISVNIVAPGQYRASQGSGVILLPKVGDKETTWVLTAEHVVDGLRQVREVIGKDGETKKQVTYRDAEIVQERVNAGRGVGERRYDAKVMSVDPRRDIAILRVRIDGEFDRGAQFYLGEEIPIPGTPLFHCGAPGGKSLGGTCSLTSGIVSRLGVRIPDFGGSEHGVFDQVTCPALGGSSGGLVALEEDGQIAGIITLGLRGADSFHWMVPVRSLLDYADEADARWLFDPNAERPESEDEIDLPLELNPTGFAVSRAGDTADPYRAYRITDWDRALDSVKDLQNLIREAD